MKSAFGDRTDLLSSVAFWYQQGVAQGLPEPPYGAGRLPQGNALQIEIEKSLAEARAEKGKTIAMAETFTVPESAAGLALSLTIGGARPAYLVFK